MTVQVTELYFSDEKAVYLFTHETDPGEGDDKKKYWTEIMVSILLKLSG